MERHVCRIQVCVALTLIIKAIDTVYRGAFVVATQQKEVLWIFDFVGKQQADRLQGLLPPVHIVTQEQVIAFWREASIFKQSQEIIVLTMDITCRGQQRSRI